MDISIVIVNYNTCQLTVQALHSVFASKADYAYEVILVDNHSTDDSVMTIKEKFPSVTLIENKQNQGFAVANNQAIQISSGRYILLLNSDTVIQKDTLQIMIDYMERHRDVGVAGCKVVLPDGSLDKACKRGFPTPSASFYYAFGFSKLFPNNPKFNQYHLSHLDPDEPHEVDCLVGAFMMVRRETIAKVGMLDEDYFMYGDDIDWCYRIKSKGWKITYYPRTIIVHYKKASSHNRRSKKIIKAFHKSMLIFYDKHYINNYSWFVRLLVYAGVYIKYTQSLLLNLLH